ncbi:hypothetical protein FRB99_006753 [Tulasnella sp. 403]|nr:hypothetical protein FRB99_006753 [Tulasnella sp. 403]
MFAPSSDSATSNATRKRKDTATGDRNDESIKVATLVLDLLNRSQALFFRLNESTFHLVQIAAGAAARGGLCEDVLESLELRFEIPDDPTVDRRDRLYVKVINGQLGVLEKMYRSRLEDAKSQSSGPSKRPKFEEEQAAVIAKEKIRPGPSKNAPLPVFKFLQEGNNRSSPLLCGRTETTIGNPVEIYCDAFRQFRADLHNTTPIDSAYLEDTIEFIARATAFYDDETKRRATLKPILQKLLGRYILQQMNDDNTYADGVIMEYHHEGDACAYPLIMEVENEIGQGDSDPFHEAALSYRHYWAFQALAWGIASLADYYRPLLFATSEDPYRFYPSIRQFSLDGELDRIVRFVYKEQLSERMVFRARSEDGTMDLIIKFTYSYNRAAHQLLANARLAPRLLHVDPALDDPNRDPDMPGSGPWMVVMEHTGRDLMQVSSKERIERADQIMEAVETAIKHLHEADFVFGDLRPPNVVVDGERIGLVDFEWCSRDGVARYPESINMSLSWPAGEVKRGGLIKEHDIFMMEMLRRFLKQQ